VNDLVLGGASDITGARLGSVGVWGKLKGSVSQLGSSLQLGGAGPFGALLPLGAAMLGGKLGGNAGAIGAAAMSMGVLLGSGVLGIAGGGLLGFGIGSQHGYASGALSGAGTGALTGFMVGGPVGAVIGGIIGLFGGLFGGWFGGRKRRKQAEKMTGQYLSEITSVLTAYKSFQTDYGTAIESLNAMYSEAEAQYSKLKKEGKKEFQRNLAPRFSDAQREIEMLEKERQRRMGLVFGAPQFHSGGYVSGQLAGWRMQSGEVFAVLKRGEYVVNPEATAKHRSTLEQINSGQAVAMGGLTINGPLIQAQKIDEAWLRNGGAVEIMQAIRKAKQEGY